MTSKLDRIQENANKYIVKNCPSTYLNFEDKYVCTSQIKEKGFPFYCQDCIDCVIKQVIEKCKETLNLMESASGRNAYAGGRCTEAGQILQLFDIEEINK